MMGVGNLTELTEADTAGINATLFGIIAELGVTDVLMVRKSPHCRQVSDGFPLSRWLTRTLLKMDPEYFAAEIHVANEVHEVKAHSLVLV